MHLLVSCLEFVVELSFSGIKSRSSVSRLSVLPLGLRLGEAMLLLWIALFGEDWGDICLVLLSGDVREDISSCVTSLW